MLEAAPRWRRLVARLTAIIDDLLASAATIAGLAVSTPPGGGSLAEAASVAYWFAISSAPFVTLGASLLAVVDHGLSWTHTRGRARVIVLLSSAAVLGCAIMVVFMACSTDLEEFVEKTLFLGAIGDCRTVLVVDEAAMLNSWITGGLLAEARTAGIKVILAGDDRQLAYIKRSKSNLEQPFMA